jgi:UDP-N-acetylglucosamine transferase subunit ALG13
VILVTVGTQFFDELILEADRLAALGLLPRPVRAQVGLTRLRPRHLDCIPFDRDLPATARAADLVITHAGTGSLCEFITLGRPFIAVVNDTKAGNHQLEFVRGLCRLYDFCWVASPAGLREALPLARPARRLGGGRTGDLGRDIRRFLHDAIGGRDGQAPAAAV